MKPSQALRLPCAELTDEQRKHVADAIEMLEGLYPQSMTRAGMSVDIMAGDMVVLSELQRHCNAEGWLTHVQPNILPPRVHGGKPMLVGFKLTLTPPPGAYDEVDAELVQ